MSMISTVGASIPMDVLAATSRYAGPLGWDLQKATPRADGWLESKFAPWTRSILEDWAGGAFDQLDCVVFSRAEDNAHRLYYYICELRSRGLIAGPEPLIFDVAFLNRGSSLTHTIEAVRRLAARFGLDEGALERGIAAMNQGRKARDDEGPSQVCILAGAAPPDRRLHDAIRAQGWSPSGETLREQWQRLGALVEQASGDAAAAIGRQVHAEQSGPRGQRDPTSELLARTRRTGAKAAVLWFTEEEEALVWRVPAMRRALDSEGIPVLTLVRRSWRLDDGAEAEIADFLGKLAA
jgi:hypothetical protein